jgi:DNA-directed RNA polymerase subunit RPC12/RpoP
MFVCTGCGREWSAMMGDNEVPEDCPDCNSKVIEDIVDPRLDQGILDDLVHDLVSENASAINNQGAAGQIEYIISVLGREKGLQAIEEVLEVPTLCPYHEDSLDWDNCTEGFEGCQVEEVRKAQFGEEETNDGQD